MPLLIRYRIWSDGGDGSDSWIGIFMEREKRRRARSSRLLIPLSGMSGQPDGGRLAGRVLAYLYNPGRAKKVPGKMEKVARICVEIERRAGVHPHL